MDSLRLQCAECGIYLADAENAYIYVGGFVAYCPTCDERIRRVTVLDLDMLAKEE